MKANVLVVILARGCVPQWLSKRLQTVNVKLIKQNAWDVEHAHRFAQCLQLHPMMNKICKLIKTI